MSSEQILSKADQPARKSQGKELNNFDQLAATSSHLLRLSIKGGEYTYAKADDIIMVESNDHLTIVHVAQQTGKVKTTLRNGPLKEFLLALPKNCFLRVNRFCAVNLNRLSGGSYHEQFFEFDHSIKVRPKHRLPHTIFSSIGR